MSNKTRKRIWPAALMSLAVFGVLVAVVALATMQPQPAQAHECDSSTMTPAEYAGCVRDHQIAGLDGNTDHNHPPMAKGSIAAATVTAGDKTDAMDVSMYFEDTDEDDTLTYSASSSDEAVATVAIRSGSEPGDPQPPGGSSSSMLTITGVAAGEATITVTANDGNGGTATQTVAVTVAAAEPDAPDTITSSSTSGGAGVELILTIQSLPMAAVDGSSVELYLEDDFQVPDSIDRDTVYFTVSGDNVGVNQNNGGRVYSTYGVDIDDSDHFTENKDDYSIRVFIPDMNNAENSGYNGPTMGQTLTLVFTTAAGIKNPTEAGTHHVGYSVLGVNAEANDEPMYSTESADAAQAVDMAMKDRNDAVVLGAHDSDNANDDNYKAGLKTLAKITLSDEDAGRGKEITITGSGFNNDTGAEVFVFVSNDKPKDCQALVGDKKTGKLGTMDSEKKEVERHSLGKASVGSDDKFVVTYTVHQDEFNAGAVNHICAADSEAGNTRFSSDVDTFTLEASATVSPASASFGDEVTLKPRDFVDPISKITLGPTCSWTPASGDTDCFSVEPDGSDFVFELPGNLDERIQIAVTDGDQTKRIYMGVVASTLTLSKSEVAPNESIVISGSGFNDGVKILVSKITIDGAVLDVDNAGTEGRGADRYVTTTSNGTFTVTARVWAMGDSNPALDDDTYTIKVVDEENFEGEAEITIKAPSIMVSPDTASPRDYIVISGENWPVTTADLDNEVDIIIHRGETYERKRSANVDGNGRFRYEYQLPAGVRIGDDQKVQVRFDGDGGDIEEDTTFAVTEAELAITPAAAAPGQTISVEIEGMPPYTLVAHVKIDGANRIGGRNVNTDREGNATVADILVPFLDPGFYPVEVKVGDETRVAQLEVLSEALVPGVAAELPDAVSDLGDNLDAIFHFNNTSKEWTFYDPRPEFADLNTLTELNGGQPYWVLVKDSQEDVDWNGRLVSFTCAGGDCWNLEIW